MKSLYLTDKRILNTIRIIERKIEGHEIYSANSANNDIKQNIDECNENKTNFNEEKCLSIKLFIYEKIKQDGYLQNAETGDFYLKEKINRREK